MIIIMIIIILDLVFQHITYYPAIVTLLDKVVYTVPRQKNNMDQVDRHTQLWIMYIIYMHVYVFTWLWCGAQHVDAPFRQI